MAYTRREHTCSTIITDTILSCFFLIGLPIVINFDDVYTSPIYTVDTSDFVFSEGISIITSCYLGEFITKQRTNTLATRTSKQLYHNDVSNCVHDSESVPVCPLAISTCFPQLSLQLQSFFLFHWPLCTQTLVTLIGLLIIHNRIDHRRKSMVCKKSIVSRKERFALYFNKMAPGSVHV